MIQLKDRAEIWLRLPLVLVIAALLMSSYALLQFDPEWAPSFRIVSALALQMPSVAGAIIVGLFGRSARPAIASAAFAAVGFVLAYPVARSFVATEDMTSSKAVMFALAHGLTAFVTIYGISYAIRLRQPVRGAKSVAAFR